MFYTCLKCKACKREFILLTDDVKNMQKGRYIACPYCNSKRIYVSKIADDLRKCMSENAYKRVRGALRQVINK